LPGLTPFLRYENLMEVSSQFNKQEEIPMRKSVLAIASAFLFVFLVSSNSFAQSGDEYVRNTKVVPDITASGWVHVSARDDVRGEFVSELYSNDGQELAAILQVRNHGGSRKNWL